MDFESFKNKFQKEPVKEVPNEIIGSPIVSVCVQTYQHVNYIKECLDGILMQQTSFSFEILLGEDESTDGTREICLEYANNYPDKIKLFLHHRENNIKINGTPTGRFNFAYNLFTANGKYIALCEGDDYWTDPLKLQKQVDFMEENEEFGICFHNVSILEQEVGKKIPDYVTREVPEETNAEDLAKGNFIHTPSVILRNNFELPKWFTAASMGDWTLYMLQIKNQKIKKLDEEMAIYRIHKDGLWAKNPRMDRINKTIENIRLIKKNLPLSKTSKSLLNQQIQSFIGQYGVSVCVPTYNGAKYLSETLESIQVQTYQNIEVIISDDSSSDGTLLIAEDFKKQSNFPVYIFHHTPSGIGANWNNCLKHAKGKYIKFLFQDDVMAPNCLEEMAQVLETNQNLAMVACKREFIIEKEMNTVEIAKWIKSYCDLQEYMNLPKGSINILDKSIFGLKTFYCSPLNKVGEPSTVLFRRNVIDEVGYFDEDLKQILDYEYWYRILKKYPIAIINKALVRFRLHGMQATNVNRNKKIHDYKIYEEILYHQYYELLHPDLQRRLYKKYHPIARLKIRIKKILNR